MIELIKPSVGFLFPNLILSELELLQQIEKIGRVCYKSEDKITEDSAKKFVQKLIKLGHESVLEHIPFTIEFIIDRGVAQELLTHRIASRTAESTRFCNYGKKGLTFIIPPWVDIEPGMYDTVSHVWGLANFEWASAMFDAATTYNSLLELGWSPQKARSVLPNSLKSEVITTMNLRQWRYVLRLRTAPNVHPQMAEIMLELLGIFKLAYPTLFADIGESAELDANTI